MVNTPPRIAVLIPAFNEARTIVSILEACLQHLPDVFVVDDGSTDETAALSKSLPITLIQNPENLGKSASLVKGIEQIAQQAFSHIITLDADGQHDPQDIPRMLQAIHKAPDHITIAARLKHNENAPRSRLFANHVGDFFISWAAGQKIYDSQSGFRAYPIQVRSLLKQYDHDKTFVFESELLIRAGLSQMAIGAISIDSCYPDHARASYFKPSRDLWHITKMVGYYLLKQRLNLPGLKTLFSKQKPQP